MDAHGVLDKLVVKDKAESRTWQQDLPEIVPDKATNFSKLIHLSNLVDTLVASELGG